MKKYAIGIALISVFFINLQAMDTNPLVPSNSTAVQAQSLLTDIFNIDFLAVHFAGNYAKAFAAVGFSGDNAKKLSLARTLLLSQYNNRDWMNNEMTLEQAAILSLFELRRVLKNLQPMTLDEVGSIYKLSKEQFATVFVTIPESVYAGKTVLKLSKTDKAFLAQYRV